MGYGEIDDIIYKWAEKNGLRIVTSDRGDEIRYFVRKRFDKKGVLVEGVSITIGSLFEGKIRIWASHYEIVDINSKKKYPRMETSDEKEFEVSKAGLFAALEEAFGLTNLWM